MRDKNSPGKIFSPGNNNMGEVPMGSISAVSRRQFIVAGAGAAGVLAINPEIGFSGLARAQEAKPLPSYVAWKNPQAMIVHSSNTLETKRDFYGVGGITPSNELFVRNNLSSPNEEIVAKPDAWEVTFGGVKKPRSLKLGEMRNLGLETVVADRRAHV